MKLFTLRPDYDYSINTNKWTWDCAYGFVIRAKDEESARKLAAKRSGDEGPEVWLSNNDTICEELTELGEEEIVMIDFLSG